MSIANTQSETIFEAGIVEPNDQTEARVEHLKELENLVGNSYPNKFVRSFVIYKIESEREENKNREIQKLEDTISRIQGCREINDLIPQLAEGEKPAPEVKEEINRKLKEFGSVRIAGRLATPPRTMGKAAFVHLSDGVKRLQIYVRRDDVQGIYNGAKSEPSASADGLNADNSNVENNPPVGAGGSDTVSGWEMFKLFDHGDFIGVSGYLFLTNTGELSVHVETLQFLSKSLLPMPDKMHGIADPELQRRYRYADLIASSLQVEHEGLTTREVFERRAKLISGMRRFLDDHDFIEVETPMLTPKATGAAAEPFETFHKALGIPLYARIAPELYLKRLMVGGFEKVYELNRNFRNEGLSHKHSPEFTMLEFYVAYMDVNGMMDFAEAMIKDVVMKANDGSLIVKYGENEIDFSKFERLTMKESIAKHISENQFVSYGQMTRGQFDISWLDNLSQLRYLAAFTLSFSTPNQNKAVFLRNVLSANLIVPNPESGDWERIPPTELGKAYPDEAEKYTREYIEKVSPTFQSEEIEAAATLVKLFEWFAEPYLIQPTFIIDYPKSISPLSKASPENPNIAERFELFINGAERANGFSELNDPQEQYERFVDQMKERETGDEEAMVLDEDYIRALAYGMPPAAGIGIGIDRLVMLLTNKHSIRDVILFPHMRPEKNVQETVEKVEVRKIISNGITQEFIDNFFEQLKKDGLDKDDEVLYVYEFASKDAQKLEKLSQHFEKEGFIIKGIFDIGDENGEAVSEYILEIKKSEKHNPFSMMQRQIDFSEIAKEFDVEFLNSLSIERIYLES